MTTEEKARAYDKALEIAREYYNSPRTCIDVDALQEIFPELKESEDERIRKRIRLCLDECVHSDIIRDYERVECLDYLEKRKESIEKEYVFRPLAGTDIATAAIQAIGRAKEGDHLVFAFNGMYIPVNKYNSAKELVDEYEAYLEKQKDLDKMIVVSPEVWDNAISEAYENGKKEGEKQKEPHYTKRNALFDKCVENCDPEVMKSVSDEVDERLEKEKQKSSFDTHWENGSMVCEQKEQKPSIFPPGFGEVRWNPISSVQQKPSEWSEEDEKTLDCIINVLDKLGFEEYCKSSRDQDVKEERLYHKEIQCLKKLKSLHPQPKDNKCTSPEEGDIVVNKYGEISVFENWVIIRMVAVLMTKLIFSRNVPLMATVMTIMIATLIRKDFDMQHQKK